MLGRPLGQPFGELGRKPKKAGKPLPSRTRAVRFGRQTSPNYVKIQQEVTEKLTTLPAWQRSQVSPLFTLPEIIVALALLEIGWSFISQASEMGGRLFLGGGVVDFKVWIGASVVLVRVQGDYWHSLPGRVKSDAMQYARLKGMGYRVADIWEHDLYTAWTERSYRRFVEDAVTNAA